MELVKKAVESVTKTSAKLITKAKVHSPEILVGIGIGGIIGSLVLTIHGTIKAQEVIAEFNQAKEDIQSVKELMEDPEIETSSTYTEEDEKRDTFVMYAKAGKGFIRAYGPAVAVMGTSIACILWGFGILKGRHAALIAAYNTLDQSYSKYRERVKEALGDDKDHEFRYGIKEVTNVEEVTDENGKKKKIKKKENEITNPLDNISPYARFFDETSLCYEPDPFYNLTFLKQQQAFMNQKFSADGYLFLNDVYDALGIQKSFPMGQMVGWLKGEGDDFVDFGIYDGNRREVREFVNGLEPAILLDFNVDGVIYDKI